MLPRYASLAALRRHLGPEHPLRGAWRLLDSRIGQFHALPGMRGVQLATDGCHLIAESEQGDRVFVGHITNWVLDSSPVREGGVATRSAKADNMVSLLLKGIL